MLLRVTTVVILALFIQYIEGIDRVIVVSESDVHVNSYDEDIIAASATGSGSGSYVFVASMVTVLVHRCTMH